MSNPPRAGHPRGKEALQGELLKKKEALLRELLKKKLEKAAGAATRTLSAGSLRPRGSQAALPLSFAQQALWLAWRMEPASSAYNVHTALELTGDLNLAALTRALGEIVHRHEALRTTFEERDGMVTQIIHAPAASFDLPLEDLTRLEADAREAAAERMEEEGRRPFDLSAGPVFRATLLRRSSEDHVLLLTMHHIVSDGWSLNVLWRELSALYEAYEKDASSPSSPLPALRLQYADYAIWQREYLTGDVLAKQVSCWRTRLAGAPALLALPTDHPRPATQSDRGARHAVTLSRELLDGLRVLAQREGATLYMVLLAAFQVLLGKYSGQTDVVVGSPIAGRTHEQTEALIGVFLNTLALRADLSNDPSFRDLLAQVRETTLEAYEHQALPFERLVEELAPERSPAYHPLYQVMFALQNAPTQATTALGELRVRRVTPVPRTATGDITLHAFESADGLQLLCVYRTDLFEGPTIARLLGHYGRLLAEVVETPAQRLSQLALIDAPERHQVLVEWNVTAADIPRDLLLHELFEAQAGRTPDAIAMVAGDAQLTYRTLDARANQAAHYLRRQGVGPEVCVGLCLERGPELVVSMLAVLKAGGACVPLDPALPSERLAYMLEASGAAFVLTRGDAAYAGRDSGVTRVIRLEEMADAAAREPEAIAPASGVRAENLAYVIYTSGSTGRPKGVLGTHGQATHYLAAVVDSYGLRGDTSVLQIPTMAVDASLREIFGAFSVGARLVLLPAAGAADPRVLLDHLVTHSIDGIWAIVPSFLDVVLGVASERRITCPALRTLLVAGEAFPAPLAARVREILPHARVINQYGPTEATITATYLEVSPADDRGGILSLGRPLPNVRVYVLDASLQLAPVGVAGEAYLAGAGITRGYANQPAATAERFVPDPFSEDPGQRVYRTGDRVRWLADGRLEFLGRVDDQVKLRGFRIEPGEVESVLRTAPDVVQAAIVLREDRGERRLVAYVSGDRAGATRPSVKQLRAHLQTRLPAYMMPSAFVVLETLPLLPNGKLDRHRLPSPDYADDAEQHAVAPRTPTEELLAGIWADVLQADRVGVHDDFFVLGGHSLMATRVVTRVREMLNIELPLRALLECPTVAALASRIEGMRRSGKTGRLPAIEAVQRSERPEHIPLSFAQQRLWFLDRLEPDSSAYIIPLATRLTGALDVRAFERALEEIVRRHESLRTTFESIDGAAVQVIHPPAALIVPVEDLTHLDAGARERIAEERVAEEARTPFDLSTGPMLRAKLLRLSSEEHVLLLTMHHIVSDAWSLGVLVRELSVLYEAYGQGAPSPLPAARLQYADYTIWQRAHLTGDVLADQLAYWRTRLADAPALLALPTDHPRPAVQSERGAQQSVTIPRERLAALRALAQTEGATLYMVLLAAFQVLLGKYSGQSDVVVGTSIAGRTHEELENLIGFFVNTLALRADLSGDPSFRALLAQVRETTLDAYEHQALPFERLVEELAPERSLAHSPIFQVMLVLQNAPRHAGTGLTGLQMTPAPSRSNHTTQFDLVLHALERPEGLRLELTYRTDLFEAASITRLLAHYQRLLDQVCVAPARRLSQLELLDASERRRVLVEWNATAADIPRDRCLHELFEAQAARTPDAIAVVAGDAQITYQALDARATKTAHYLRRLGVGPEVRVGVRLPRGLAFVVSMLGVLKAGGAYVPLDPALPHERQSSMLETCEASLVLTSTAETAAIDGIRAIALEEIEDAIRNEPEAILPASGVRAENLAYVIYTSGSTGWPKGVLGTHGQATHYLASVIERYGLRGGASVLQVPTMAVDGSVREIFGAFAIGARLVLLPADHAGDPHALWQHLVTERIDGIWAIVPSFLNALLRLAHEQGFTAPALRTLLVAGEAFPAPLAAQARVAFPAARIINQYGPTEATITATYAEVGPEPNASEITRESILALGRPLPNVRVYVLDESLQPTPAGVSGEAYLGGVGITRGYAAQPAVTADRFVPDPFSVDPGQRLYRTGDRVRWLADGRLEFLGRVDHQVKLRGFRVEPGEIEVALRQCAGVAEAAVLLREDDRGEPRLVAYVTASVTTSGSADPADLSLEGLRAQLQARLPDYMMPSAVVTLDAFPRLANGKLNRAALPAPAYGGSDAEIAPRTPVEELLAGIWTDLLRVDRVGIHDDFFALGGHSLIATRVVARVRETLGIEMPLRALLEAPTIAALARRVDEARRSGATSCLPPIVAGERPAHLPLSFAQQRLWFLDRLEPGSTAYLIPLAARLIGPLKARALERALAEIVRRHETLRTTFEAHDGVPVQVIHAPAPADSFTLTVEDLTPLDAGARERKVAERVDEEAQTPFDLSVGPLFRATLLRLSSEEHVLLVTLHHIVGDGWSVGVLSRELSALYESFGQFGHGESSALPALSVQYADYALWQRAHLAGDVLAEQLTYWRTRLAGAPPLLMLPTDHPRPAVQSERGARHSAVISRELLEPLKALARREGVTLYMVLLAAFQVLLGKYSGQTDIVVGSPIAGRTREALEPLIGFFVNTLALRADLSGDPTFRDLLAQVRETTLDAYEYQAAPFEQLVEELAPERSLAYSPIFQVLFALQNAPDATDTTLAGLQVRSAPPRTNHTTKYDLTLNAFERGDGLHLLLGYRTDLFEPATMTRLLAHFERLLADVSTAPERRLSEIDVLDDAERRRVLVEWNDTAADLPGEECLHELFESQVARTPDAIAVVAGESHLTYEALDARANQVAHGLRRRGVGPDVLVGLYVERSFDMVAGAFGVLKAGGAYVPLDPSHPPERLAYMLEDAGVNVVLAGDAMPAGVDEGPGAHVSTLRLGNERNEFAHEPSSAPKSRARGDNLAYVIYTSGSTGCPKGVAVLHAGLTNYLWWSRSAYAAAAVDGPGAPVHSPLTFDLTVTALFLPLIVGQRVVMVPEDPGLETLTSALTSLGEASWLKITPAHLNLLGQRLERERAGGGARVLVVGGEALNAQELEYWRRHAPDTVVVNEYGPTETVVGCCVQTLRVAECAGGAIPIGRPIANTQMYVLDRSGRVVPVGAVGEICIGGLGLARGYWKRPALTAEKFVPDPFSGRPGARLYRTGDFGRHRSDGTLEYLGRLDEQVKIRGYRIELGEIEAALSQHPAVREAVVVAREQNTGIALVGYVAAHAQGVSAGVTGPDLREYLRSTLPDYMVPTQWVIMDALPLTSHGKVDRRALPDPGLVHSTAHHEEPRRPIEELLAGIWAELLGVDVVGLHDDFFALGGHSLIATRVVSRVRDVIGIELPLRTLLESPTVADLARRVDEARASGLSNALPPIHAAERPSAIPLSFEEQRLWFLDRLDPASTAYIIPLATRLRGPLDAGLLERAFGEVMRRHEALRTTFEERDGAVVQVIHAPADVFRLPIEDLSHLDPAARERVAAARITEEAQTPFDLSAGPLVRARLLRLSSEEHVLLLTLHHIISDGWSVAVLSRELTALYEAGVSGSASPLPALRVQYADYAIWQRAHVTGDVLAAQLSYWRSRLAGAPALLELPTDHSRPAVQSDRGSRQTVVLSRELLDGLGAVAQREGVTLYMVLLAAFQVLLGKYSGQTDVVVGSPIAGRTSEELEALIGFFINTLALRADLSGDPTFRELLAQVRETTLGAYEHQALPFERLVEELAPQRSLAYSPLFQVMLVLQNAPRHAGKGLAGLHVQSAPTSVSDTTQYDLVLHAFERPDGLHLGLVYRTDLFEAPTMVRLLAHYERLLEQVSEAPTRRLSELDLLDASERQRVLVDWSATDPRERCLHELFEVQASRTPDAIAVAAGDTQLTYEALEARANQLAHHLRRFGVGPEVCVGVNLERGPDLLIAILAVMKAGGAYVPLDPALPLERLAYMRQASGISLVLTASCLGGGAAGASQPIVLDAIAGDLTRESTQPPRSGVRGDNLAYVIYTSGSTGRPKGVLGTHGHVAHYLTSVIEGYGLRGDAAVLQVPTMAVDACLREIFGAFSVGARLVMLPAAAAGDPRALLEQLVTQQVHGVWAIVPSYLHAVLRVASEQNVRCPALRTLLVAGEAFPAALAAQAREIFPHARIINQYGPTEGTITATFSEAAPGEKRDGILPLGRPRADVRVYVLDASLRPVPAGLAGEAYLGGMGITRGYVKQAGQTAERFVPDPFSGRPGARLYRTGDRVRWLDNGQLAFLGRLDHQVKLRGFRIEPGEVEGALRTCAGVADAAVVLRDDAGEPRLVAYVTGSGGAAPAGDVLRARLQTQLPEFMVPSAFVALEAFPLLPNGKLDRAALPAPSYDSGEDALAPRTPTEELLAGIWTELLRVKRVGVHDDFFALGGHSLIATRVVSRVREVMGIELPLRALLEAPTVSDLARRVDDARTRGTTSILPPIRAGERPAAIPLSFAQQRLWFLDRLEPGSAAYLIPLATRLTGPLKVRALERSLAELVRRHEVLRTTIEERDSVPVQVIHAPPGDFTLHVTDLSHLGSAEREQAAAARVDEEERTPFDLSGCPLFRASLLRLSAEEHILLFTLHHTIGDGWSIGVVSRELSALYGAFARETSSPLPEPRVQYADYAIWQRAHLTGDVFTEQLAYWTTRLAGAPALLALPTDRPRPAVQSDKGARHTAILSRELLDGLQGLAQREGVTLYMVLLAVFQVLLGKYSGQTDIVVGSPIAGRTREELEGLIGLFVNTLALRADLSGDPAFRELLAQVRETTLGAYEHQALPFERLVEELAPERSLSYSPLFQVMLVLQNVPRSEAGLAGLRMQSASQRTAHTTKYDLTLHASERADGLQLVFVYRTDLFEAATIERLLSYYERLLTQVSASPARRLSELDLLEAAERQQVLVDWNATEVEVSRDRCVHALFEAQAARTPEAIAVVAGDTQLTYEALDARANQLAHYLRREGVGPEVRVGVCLERDTELLVGLLGVIKAGGAYVPLDPAYPTGRLTAMLQSSGAAVVVTTSPLRARVAGPTPVICLDFIGDQLAHESAQPPETGVRADHLAYVIFTSGSTGRPKGVATPHRGVVNNLQFAAHTYGLDPADTILQLTSVSFDPSVRDLLGALCAGARVVLVRDGAAADPDHLLQALAAHHVTGVLAIVPSLLQVVVGLADANGQRLLALRLLLVSGEALPLETVRRARHVFARARIASQYGPTEGTIISAYHRLDDVTAEAGGIAPLGRPIWNVRVYVLDASLRPVPVGVAGELYLGGIGVTRGYVAQPAATADRFVPDPFSGEPGQRLYRTGDRVRWLAGGTLEFLGRVDYQVKLRGFRIELGEIEHVLRDHPGVDTAAVLVRDDAGDERLVAYVTTTGAAPGAGELRAWLQARLPDYMVPSAIVPLPAFPLLPNGKLNRAALPAPSYDRQAAMVAPRTPTEELLAGIWTALLPVARIGVHDNFFELGGHSLIATRVAARVRQVFGIELPLRAVFELPRVADLATLVDDMRRSATGRDLAPIGMVQRPEHLPLSFAQQRLWFLDRLEPGSTAYSIPLATRLTGPLPVSALERALGEIVRRHEVLRTTFEERDGEPVQVIHAPADDFVLPIEDLSHLDADTRERLAATRVEEEAQIPFDLSTGPLVRARLLRLSAEEHVLLFTMHHIVSDGWSLSVVIGELSTLFEAFSQGEPSPLPALRVQYADYALWQRAHLTGDVVAAQVDYWTNRLAGAPPLLQLPTDHPRPALESDRGAGMSVMLSRELLDGLRTLAQREGVTLYMVLLAAFQVLLGKYSGQTDIVVGSPIAGRTSEELEELVGFFVNTLALRADLSGDPAFRELLAQVRETTLSAYEHQALPFERLVEELAPERTLSYSPLFQVMLVLQNTPRQARTGLTGLRLQSASPRTTHTAKYDVNLTAIERDEGLHLYLVYRTDLFAAATIERLLSHYERVLTQVSAAPARRLSELDLLEAAERQQVLVDWNATDVEVPRDRCVHALFDAQAARTPDAIAVVAGETQVTYAALATRANQLAHHLRRAGVGPDVCVGVCLERNASLLVGLLGVLKAGGAYVPLDPAYPAGRLTAMLQSSGAAMVLTTSPLRARVAGLAPVICLDAIGDQLADESAQPPETGVRGDNLAYVIFTSGSTGRPKGVATPHRGVVNNLQFAAHTYELGPADTILQLTSVSFDPSVRDLLGALCAGARVVLVRDGAAADPDHLLQALAAHQVTGVLAIVPSLLQVVVGLADANGQRLLALRLLLVSGEALPLETVRRAQQVFARARIASQYGPTEGTIISAYHRLDDVTAEAGGIAPLGRPIWNVRVYVLDASLRPVPVGVAGELYLGGIGVTRGYVAQPAATADRFVPDPFSGEPGQRLYRTGDRVRWLAGGTLEFLGRVDYQVKLRGFRIELGEIEHVLRDHPGVDTAAVLVRDDAGDERLVAYVTTTGAAPGAGDLRAWLQARLPDYMVPSAIVPLPAFPLLPNGKLNRAALPAPSYDGQAAMVAPRTPTEELLAGIWTALLPVARIGVHDNFFELGGHSLIATRVAARVREVFGIELPLRALLECPTIAGLARRADEARRAGEQRAVPALRPQPRPSAIPVSFAQQRLWFLDRLEPGSTAYTIPLATRLTGPLQVTALQRALGEVVRRHEALRTTFAEWNGAPVQVIHPVNGPFRLPVEDLTHQDAESRERMAAAHVEKEAQTPFDLGAGPLFRAKLLRLSADEHVLLMTLHHIVSDGWSHSVLSREVSVLYDAYVQGQPSPLPPPRVQYADYTLWQRDYLSGDVLAAHMAYWRARLSGAPALLTLPTDRPRPAVQSDRGARHTMVLRRELLDGLRTLAQREGATLYMVLLAAFQVLLGKYSGQTDIVVGSPIAGRTSEEVEELIGFFVNTLALRADLSGDPTFRELLAQVRETTLGAYEHQTLPFERLVEELAPERTLSYSPLFQVMLVLQNTPRHEQAGLSGLRVDSGPARMHQTTKYDLVLNAYEREHGLHLLLVYRTDLFDAPTIASLMTHFERLLEQVSESAGARLSDFDLLDAAERQRVLVDWNATATDVPRDRCLHDLFEAQVARTPDDVAIACGTSTISYRELDARINQLAHYLRRSGVGPEVRVGVCLERGPDLVTALLGVLKAGGAYVPLDPSLPSERLAYMLQDSGAALTLTSSNLSGRVSGALPSGTPRPVVCLDAIADQLAAESTQTPSGGARPDNVAYVIYTSGSMGRPKGTLSLHRGVVSNLSFVIETFHLNGADVVLPLTSVSFDPSVRDLLGPLCAGARVVLLTHAVVADPEEILAAIAASQVTCLLAIVPSLLHAILEAAERRQERYPSLRHLATAGEPLPLPTTGRARAVFPNVRISSQYGPSENVQVTSQYGPVERVSDDLTTTGMMPLGTPAWNVRVYVLDEHLRPVPVGVAGEAYLGGAGIARGYVDRPALTADRFTPDPFSGEPGQRLYRTGDRMRWRASGVLEFLGRRDHQVKLRGFRIELGEIETLLRQCEGVEDAAVVLREDDGEKRLVAYVTPVTRGALDASVASGGAPLAMGTLRERLRERLPEYMTPSAFVQLEAFPRLPNGKLDRAALPRPEADRARSRGTYQAPRNVIELRVAQIWEECLGVRPIGVYDNFFEIGGTSLLAIRVVGRAREHFGCQVPLAGLILNGTIAAMAETIADARRSPHATGMSRSALVPIQPSGSMPPLFCVHSAGGEVAGYINLARRMGADQPIYGLQDPWGPYGEDHDFQPVTETAQAYVEAVLSVRREGPFHLLGWSFGGTIAFEMAQQLTKRGHDVALLALLDSFPPNQPRDTSSPHAVSPSSAEWFTAMARQNAKETGRELAAFSPDALRGMDLHAQARYVAETLVRDGVIPPETQPWQVLRYFKVNTGVARLNQTYEARVYGGRITLILAGGSELTERTTHGWRALSTEPLECHVIAGAHHRLMLSEPYVTQLSDVLRECMAREERSTGDLARCGASAIDDSKGGRYVG